MGQSRLLILALVFTAMLVLLTALHPSDRACLDFNGAGATKAQFVCPRNDGVAGVVCSKTYARRQEPSVGAQFGLSEVLFYVLIGPKSKVDAFTWWLPLITEATDIVLVMDACEEKGVKRKDSYITLLHDASQYNDMLESSSTNRTTSMTTTSECDSFSRDVVSSLPSKVRRRVNFHIVHVQPEDETYQRLSCKVSTAMKEVYKAFPSKRYYIKIDTDTIVFPGRLLDFLGTMEATHPGGAPTGRPAQSSHPIYFGTVIESGGDLLLCGNHKKWRNYGDTSRGGLCYAQGGAGYGLNNFAMAAISKSPPCHNPTPTPTPGSGDITPRIVDDEFLANEDAWVGVTMFSLFNLTVIHCGGFSSSELAPDQKLRSSITFHYIDTGWLHSYGEMALKHYYAKYAKDKDNNAT